MKKTIKLAVVAALALGATSAFATNGSNMIGVGAEARGMAGTGIGMSHGAESALINPALITTVKGTEISFGGTIFMPKVKNKNNLVVPSGPGAGTVYNTGYQDSAADLSVIPAVSIASKITDNFYAGIGMWGTAGMGTDYRDTKDPLSGGTQFKMVTNLQLMQFGVPLAYTTNGFSVAFTPLLQYGSLDMNYVGTNAAGNALAQNGAGVAQDLRFGYNIGLAYMMQGFTVGATYVSKIDMDYKDQLPNAMAGFGIAYDNTKLSTPATIGVGASYAFGSNTIAFDYKQIKWSDAKGYKDFKWDDQNVLSLGYEYKASNWALRAGYNYAKSPIKEQALGSMGTLSSGADMAGLINTMNLLGFPAIIESHYAVGGTYNISEQTSIDLALTYAPETTETFKNFVGQDVSTKHSQTGVSVQLNYNF